MKYCCVTPFYQQAIRKKSIIPCCWLRDFDKQFSTKKLQETFDKGLKSKYCSHCWNTEKSGHESKRLQDNRWLSFHSKKSLKELHEHRHNKKIRSLQFTATNLCNLTCKTCGPDDSTKWYAEHNHYNKNKWHNLNESNTSKVSDETLYGLDSLEILGGEPFLDWNHITLLERLINLGKTKLHLQYTTNCQQMPHRELFKILQQFSNIYVTLSIDGIGKVFNYMRYPGKWDKTVKIVQKLKDTNWNANVYNTLSNINIYYYDKMLEWNMENFNATSHKYQFVQTPYYMSPQVMPLKMKDAIANKFSKHKFSTLLKPIVEYINQADGKESLLQTFKFTINQQDSFRKQNPKNFVPEIINYLY